MNTVSLFLRLPCIDRRVHDRVVRQHSEHIIRNALESDIDSFESLPAAFATLPSLFSVIPLSSGETYDSFTAPSGAV